MQTNAQPCDVSIVVFILEISKESFQYVNILLIY